MLYCLTIFKMNWAKDKYYGDDQDKLAEFAKAQTGFRTWRIARLADGKLVDYHIEAGKETL